MKPIKVAIAEEHRGLRERLARIFAKRADIALRGQAANGKEASFVVERLKPHILLLSMTLPELGGIGVLPLIHKVSPNTKVIMFLASSDDESAAGAIRTGARGYILKSAPVSALVKAIKVVHAGEVWAEYHLVGELLDQLSSLVQSQHSGILSLRDSLTEKELRIARLVTSGLRNSEIANMLSIGEKAVKANLTKIFRKLGLKSRVELVRLSFGETPSRTGIDVQAEEQSRPTLEQGLD